MCNGVSNATGTTPQYGTNMPVLAGGPSGTNVGGATGGGAPMKMGSVGGASGAPMKHPGQVGQVGQGLPTQGGGPTDGAALVGNPQMQAALQSLIQALSALTQLMSSQTGTTAASTTGGGAASTMPTAPTGTSMLPAAATSTVPVGGVVSS